MQGKLLTAETNLAVALPMFPLLPLSLAGDVPVIRENNLAILLRQQGNHIINNLIKCIIHRWCHVENALEYKLSFKLKEDIICSVWPILSGG